MIALAELKRRVGIEPDNREDDRLLEMLEVDAVAEFSARTNLYWGPVIVHTEVLSVGRRRSSSDAVRVPVTLRLRAPVVSLTSVELGGYGVTSSRWSTPWGLDSFEYEGRNLHLVDGTVLGMGRRNLRVTYQGGYAAGAVPRDVVAAVGQLVAYWRREGRTESVETDVTPGQLRPRAIPNVVAEVAARYYRNPGL